MVFFVSEGGGFTGLFKQRNRNNRAKKPMLKTTGFSFLLSYFIFYKQTSPLCIFRQQKIIRTAAYFQTDFHTFPLIFQLFQCKSRFPCRFLPAYNKSLPLLYPQGTDAHL